jgi:hypothetical protein
VWYINPKENDVIRRNYLLGDMPIQKMQCVDLKIPMQMNKAINNLITKGTQQKSPDGSGTTKILMPSKQLGWKGRIYDRRR